MVRRFVLLSLIFLFWAGASFSSDEALPAPGEALPAPRARGYGLTVYRGHELERFSVEILGSLLKAGSTTDLILARLSGSPLEETGVLQGMSGSPVWVDGELIGAVAATWPFAKEPLAVIRPIAEMRRLSQYLEKGEHPTWVPGMALVPAPQALSASPAQPGTTGLDEWIRTATTEEEAGSGVGDRLRRGNPPGGRDAMERDRLWPAAVEGGVTWTASGLAPAVAAALGSRIGAPLMPGLGEGEVALFSGASARSSGESLREGDPVAVVLVRGDAQLAATGTVTEIDDGTVLAFGHPFLGSGPVSLPLYRAEIVGVFPSQQVSFKFANPTTEVGVMLVDSPVGIAGRLGVKADTLPVEVEVRGENASRTFRFEVARNPALSPALVYWCVQNSLMVGQDLSTAATALLDLKVELAGQNALRTQAAVTGMQIGGALAAEVMLPLNLLAFNPGEPVRVDRVHVILDLRAGIQSAQLGRVRVRPASLKAGQKVRIQAEILPYRADPFWTELELNLPKDLPDGSYLVHLSDGGRAFAAELQRAQARWSYPGLRQIREAFAQRRSAQTLVAVLYGRSNGIVVRGREWRRLPTSVQTVLSRGRGSLPAESVAAEILARAEAVIPWVLDGERVLTLQLGEETPPAEASRRTSP